MGITRLLSKPWVPKDYNVEAVGTEAKKLFNDAQKLTEMFITNNSITLKGVVSMFAANFSEDVKDVHIYEDEAS